MARTTPPRAASWAATDPPEHLPGASSPRSSAGAAYRAACNGFQIAVQAGLLPVQTPACCGPQAATPTIASDGQRSGAFQRSLGPRRDPEERALHLDTRPAFVRIDRGCRLSPTAKGGSSATTRHEPWFKRGQSRSATRPTTTPTDPWPTSREFRCLRACVLRPMPHPERYTQWTQHPF